MYLLTCTAADNRVVAVHAPCATVGQASRRTKVGSVAEHGKDGRENGEWAGDSGENSPGERRCVITDQPGFVMCKSKCLPVAI